MADTTWRQLIEAEMGDHGDAWSNAEHYTLAPKPHRHDDTDATRQSLDAVFDDGFGGSNGCYFTLWTKDRVYFPVVYDGAEFVGSVPRNPCGEASAHVGGE